MPLATAFRLLDPMVPMAPMTPIAGNNPCSCFPAPGPYRLYGTPPVPYGPYGRECPLLLFSGSWPTWLRGPSLIALMAPYGREQPLLLFSGSWPVWRLWPECPLWPDPVASVAPMSGNTPCPQFPAPGPYDCYGPPYGPYGREHPSVPLPNSWPLRSLWPTPMADPYGPSGPSGR